MSSVYANSRSIVHKGDGQTNIAPAPDVCKTPSPGGPVPIPYPNTAQNSDLASGSKKTKIKGNSIGHKSANLSTSTGDEAGTAGGGIVSSKTKGKLTWTSSSSDVKVEGKGVVRFMDPTMHNGNTGNVPGIEIGDPNTSYGADFTGECAICGKDHASHPKVESSQQRPTAEHVIALIKKLTADEATDKVGQLATAVRARDEHVANCKGIDKKKSAIRARQAEFAANASPTQEAIQAAAEDAEELKTLIAAEKVAHAKRKEANAEVTRLQDAIKSPVIRAPKLFYMVGAMMCETHTTATNATVYVAHSGEENLEGFKRVARTMAGTFEPVPVNGKLEPTDYKEKNSFLKNDEGKMETLKQRWAEALDAAQRTDTASNVPGVCAAQHLLGYKGHQPRAITEAWFDPAEKKTVEVKHIRKVQGFYESLKEELKVDWTTVQATVYGHQSYVPSCRTCQALLPFLLCDKKPTC